jgi:hypothetical protein
MASKAYLDSNWHIRHIALPVRDGDFFMRRIQLFEIEDLSWCPNSIRDAITDCLQSGMVWTNFYGQLSPILRDAVVKSGTKEILDLGSGAGGPWPKLWRLFERDDIQIALSDKYPNMQAMERLKTISASKIRYIPDTIDSVHSSESIKGFRTIFNAFHHYRPSDARTILQNAVDSGQGIGIFESTGRHPLAFLLVAGMPFFMLLTCPFMRPFRVSRLFWTYIIPLAPIVGFLDGIVSCFRTYSRYEMIELVANLSPNNYSWEIGETRGTILRAPIQFTIGIPQKRN